MKPIRLNSWRACRQSFSALRRQPLLLLGFSLAALGAHLLSWAMFSAAEQVDSGVLAALLHLLGIGLYAGSLLWMIEGFTRAGLAQNQQQRLAWRDLSPDACWHSWRLCLYLGYLLAALTATALITGLLWSLLLLLLPSLSAVPPLLGLLTAGGILLSQIFGPCLVLETALGPTALFRQGIWLLEHHWPGLMQLSGYLLGLLLIPVILGLVAEALIAGLGSAATALALVAVLPLFATTITGAYRQLQPEVGSASAFTRSAR